MTSKHLAQWSWSLSACANHGFITTIAVGFFPIFFDKYVATSLSGTQQTFYLGLANSTATFIVMLLAPWLGALADRRGHKKRWLGIWTVLGSIGSAVLATVGQGEWVWALVVYGVGTVAFWAGSSFQDALIVQVADASEINRVSAQGYAFGYIGGGLLFLVNVLMALHPSWFHLANGTQATRIAFLDVAVWWLLFTLPLFRHVPEGRPTGEPSGVAELWATIRKVMRERMVRNFLLAYWLYIDALNTVQLMAVDFGSKLGFPSDSLIVALLIVQFIAFPFALLFGWLGDRFGTKGSIYLGLAVFVGVTFYAYFMQTVQQFYILAAIFGSVQGGVQALSRSYFARLIPADRAGEYFGFYNMLGKFAAVLGPLAMGLVAMVTGNQRLSILVLEFFFIGGGLLLARVRAPERSVCAMA
ncbi:MAG TPA: MFS transporter [Steroidobacteraceae bacterium]|nr:MFS transporter [Steroidobacteraceae bacterium]